MSKISFGLGTNKFTTDDKWLLYRSPYGRSFRIAIEDISSASVDEAMPGRGRLRVNGSGTELASIVLPRPWAYKAQEFIQAEVAAFKKLPA